MKLMRLESTLNERDSAIHSADLCACDEAELGRRIQETGCVHARNALVERNLGLVRAIAREFSHGGVRYDDLVADGNMALVNAAERFDPGRGVRFGSYAATWIRHAMRATRAVGGRPVRVPPRKLRELRSLAAARAQLMVELDRSPTVTEMAERTGLSRPQVRELAEQLDLLESTPTLDPAEHAISRVQAPDEAVLLDTDGEPTPSDRLRILVARLPDAEREVISRCFGLESNEPTSLKEVAQQMELNAAAVRRLLRSGIVRLRNAVAA